jgi:hypothetical protein
MTASTARSSRILIVEDVQETRDSIKELLKTDGYWVDPPRDEEEAVGFGGLARQGKGATIITLDRSVGQSRPDELRGDKLCFWGSSECGAGTVLVRVDPKTLVTQDASTAGYPKNKGESAMWCFTGMLASVPEKARTMVYTGELTEGQSGSPVWIERDGKYILVGIAVARAPQHEVVRVTRELCRQLAAWMGTQQPACQR